MHDVTRDTFQSCIVNSEIRDRVISAYVGRAQNIANQISADSVSTAEQKAALKKRLNDAAVSMKSDLLADYDKLIKSPLGATLVKNFNDVLAIQYQKVVQNYMTNIVAKMNELNGLCNNLNANYFATDLNKYTNALNNVNTAFKQINPNAGVTSISSGPINNNLA